MHIPDGLMEPVISLLGWIIAIICVAAATKKLNGTIDNRRVPLMAVLAAGIFVAQMLNFPIGGGTTGHLVGAALAAIILGPLAAMVVIVTILTLQCLVFGDGGVTALGLNIVNMAIIGSLTGWYVYRAFSAILPEKYRGAGIFTASWFAVFLGALACTIELAASNSMSGGEYGISMVIAFPSMLISHSVIGIGEGIITTGVVAYLAQVSPDVFVARGSPKKEEAAA